MCLQVHVSKHEGVVPPSPARTVFRAPKQAKLTEDPPHPPALSYSSCFPEWLHSLLTAEAFPFCMDIIFKPGRKQTYRGIVRGPLYTVQAGCCTSQPPADLDVALIQVSSLRAIPRLEHFHEPSSKGVVSLAHWTSRLEETSSSLLLRLLTTCPLMSWSHRIARAKATNGPLTFFQHLSDGYAITRASAPLLSLPLDFLWISSCYGGFFSLYWNLLPIRRLLSFTSFWTNNFQYSLPMIHNYNMFMDKTLSLEMWF